MKTLFNKFQKNIFKRCPKSGKIVGLRFDNIYAKVLFPVVGILAIAWFLFRVIPKPIRAAYPCQQAAMGIGGSFLAYLIALTASFGIFTKLKKNKPVLAYFSVFLFIIIGATAVIFAISENPPNYKPILTNNDGINNPMGVARGIFPGRVVWVRDTASTSWDGTNGFWWDDKNTNQQSTDKMFSNALQKIAGKNSSKSAWDKLFTYRNALNGKNQGYKKGEKIVIKVNLNPVEKPDDFWSDKGYPSPHMFNSLIKELIEVVGVRGEDIIIADPSRYIVGPLYYKIRSNPSKEFQNVSFIGKSAKAMPQQAEGLPDTTNLVYFNMPDGSKHKLAFAQCYTDASYIINYGVVRAHRVFAITSSAKNNFGAVWDFKLKKFTPSSLHAFAQWDYPTPNKYKQAHSSPVMLGHKTVYTKTMLYLADGLYPAYNQFTGNVQRMSSMNNDWLSSLLVSLDPVALESVCYDLICSEPNLTRNNPSFNGEQDNQFQECALANNPPSGNKYDPENDGTGLPSLGVHEHWNNSKDMQYSRNLGKKNGIELVTIKK